MAHAEVGGELDLEGLDLGPEDVATLVEDRGHAVVQLPAQGRQRRRGVEERDGQEIRNANLPGRVSTLLVAASITDSLATFAQNVVKDLGLPGVFVLMVLESACIPIPSEATMLFTGFNVSKGEYTLLAATLVGSVANLVGSWIAYAVGYYGRIDLLEKHGRKLHVSPSQLKRADRWFERWGAPTVFFTRMLPIIRTFISLPAGVARMPFWRFSLFTFAGCLPWVFTLTFIGKQAGDNWDKWKDSLHYVDYAVAALIVVAAIVLFLRWRSRRGAGSEPAADAPS